MFLHNWETRSTYTAVTYSKGEFVIHINPNMKMNLTNGEYELCLHTTVYNNGIKVNKFFNDFNTAVAYCEGRL